MILSKMTIEDSFVCTIKVNGVQNPHGTHLSDLHCMGGKKVNYP